MASGTLVFKNPTLAVATNRHRKKKKKKSKHNASPKRKGVRGMARRRRKKSTSKRRRRAGRSTTRSRRTRRNTTPTTNVRRRRRGGRRRARRNTAATNRRRRRPRRNALAKNRRRVRRNQRTSRSQIAGMTRSFKELPKSLSGAVGPILAGAAMMRADDMFSGRVGEMIGVEADSLAGKGVRVGTLILAGVLLDGLTGRRKAINWTWGEMLRNFGLMKLTAELLEDEIEPRLGIGTGVMAPGEEEPLEVISVEEEPTGGTVQQSSPVAVAGMNGGLGNRVAGLGRRRHGAMVTVPPPIFG